MMLSLYHIRDLKHALVLSAVAYHVRGRQRKITLIGDRVKILNGTKNRISGQVYVHVGLSSIL